MLRKRLLTQNIFKVPDCQRILASKMSLIFYGVIWLLVTCACLSNRVTPPPNPHINTGFMRPLTLTPSHPHINQPIDQSSAATNLSPVVDSSSSCYSVPTLLPAYMRITA